MNKEVIISIRGAQSYADVENEVIELVTSGTLSDSETGYSFSYVETELTGLEGTVTTFQVEKKPDHPSAAGRSQLPDGLRRRTQALFHV